MAYEKKIEPISKWEAFMSGFTLQLWLIFLNILPWAIWSNDCLTAVFDTDLDDTDAVENVHYCIKDHRTNMLTGTTFLLLGYPVIIAHCYYEYRISETVGSFMNLGLSRTLYFGSWMIGASILCTVVPALLIFVSYYDWEFGNNMHNVGYAIQFQFMNFGLIVYDSIIIPLGIVAAMPWIWNIAFLIGDTPMQCCQWYKSSHFSLSILDRKKLLGIVSKCPCVGHCCAVIMCAVLFCMCIFGALGNVLDFDKDGFFSYHGGSQFLSAILYISWQAQAILEMRLACVLDDTMTFLNENVQSMSTQDGLSKGR